MADIMKTDNCMNCPHYEALRPYAYSESIMHYCNYSKKRIHKLRKCPLIKEASDKGLFPEVAEAGHYPEKSEEAEG